MSNYNFVKPNYYAIIPANVRYDDKISANAKLLYGEITSLCNKEGKCWATNSYFSKLYNVHKNTISKWISSLVDLKYIEIEIIYAENSKEIVNRYIRIRGEGINEISYTPINEMLKDNNTSINIKFNIPTVDELEKYKKEKGYQCDVKQFFNYHESKGWIVGKVKMKNWKRALSFWESNNKKWSKKDGDKTTARATYASSIYDYDKATDF